MKTIFDYSPSEYQTKIDSIIKELRAIVTPYLQTDEYNEFDIYRAFALSSILIFHAGATKEEAAEAEKEANVLALQLHQQILKQLMDEKIPIAVYFSAIAKLLFLAAAEVEGAVAEELKAQQEVQEA